MKHSNRSLSILVFMLFSAWLISFPYEGQVLYALLERYGFAPTDWIVAAIIAQFCGLVSSMFFVRGAGGARRLLISACCVCMAGTGVFFIRNGVLLRAALLTISFVSGQFISAWGYYFRAYTPSGDRMGTAAKTLAFSALIMIPVNLCALYVSPHLALGICLVLLAFALYAAVRLEAPPAVPEPEHRLEHVSLARPLIILCLFILVITINSGLMFSVVLPSFSHIGLVSNVYWAVPYAIGILLVNRAARRIDKAPILLVAIAMLGLSFVAFAAFPHTVWNYLLIDTLLLGACGINDLFWWSILGEMLDFDRNPSRTLGIGLGANVAGVLAGKYLGALPVFAGSSSASALAGMAVVCLALILLPPLHRELSQVIRKNAFLVSLTSLPPEEQQKTVAHIVGVSGLSERESEIAMLLLRGYPYKLVASRLFISESTVKSHVQNIYSKLGIHSRTELIEKFGEKLGESGSPPTGER